MTSSCRCDVIFALLRHYYVMTSSWRHDVIMLWFHRPKYSYILHFDLDYLFFLHHLRGFNFFLYSCLHISFRDLRVLAQSFLK